MKVADLKPNPKNPRRISDAKLELLKKALNEFGDLGGFVFNRKTKHLIGGHQRAKVFEKNTEVTIEKKYPKPTRTGTVAEGFVVLQGERFKYREVSWDEPQEKAATIAANKSAGDWDHDLLTDWLVDISDFGMDLGLTMFDEIERRKLMPDLVNVSAHDRDKTGSKEISADEFSEFQHQCPKCKFEFNDA